MDESSNFLATQYVTDYMSQYHGVTSIVEFTTCMDWLNLMEKISTDIHVGYTTKRY